MRSNTRAQSASRFSLTLGIEPLAKPMMRMWAPHLTTLRDSAKAVPPTVSNTTSTPAVDTSRFDKPFGALYLHTLQLDGSCCQHYAETAWLHTKPAILPEHFLCAHCTKCYGDALNTWRTGTKLKTPQVPSREFMK